ncbi:hypothetical protein ABB37_06224 [Leptomonas pyrrhocoris]|uniref:Uncharacterized protein n=1 Tax=Leptomonas pyrrhocoris TaxID=157538 RepID=A0A0N0VEK3_LEPPY|nr:hypothetical protein ABB37_06224 [Leptomonas pyrrhocoris]KPA78624.1 hypothetical protein ABB37_06224 [Leptomonas pyrrhocoris]|eukprot:XP_015657063.1 hypothetical protein ABB37_06224 [Leptomonas pyrrhocoris]
MSDVLFFLSFDLELWRGLLQRLLYVGGTENDRRRYRLLLFCCSLKAASHGESKTQKKSVSQNNNRTLALLFAWMERRKHEGCGCCCSHEPSAGLYCTLTYLLQKKKEEAFWPTHVVVNLANVFFFPLLLSKAERQQQ